ncbi:MAG: 1-deoxy-D-xylulose-5-phosphate reductoisomerase [Burkholderiales bacterium]|nr:1-deoxy-D-xylulose-5-phosphate reductoisomerase [Burkholderiales bacterium]
MKESMQNITVLGSTGSIGKSTLDVVARHPERFSVFALSANSSHESLFAQCVKFRPRHAVMLDPEAAEILSKRLLEAGIETEVDCGVRALEKIASHPDVHTVMAAIVGAAGMPPALAAARAGKRILLANKETLVMTGELFMTAVKEHDATILPIDSEHNAIFQALPQHYSGDPDSSGVRRILLTASGGPFRARDKATLANVTPEEACKHPNWSMGRKISVDSATMMNKGLEVIEAHWLFGADADRIRVVVHPESIIHSMVEYVDGSILAQLGNPDMRTPIAHALGYPERIESGVGSLDLFSVAKLHFEEPDFDRFPCLRLAFHALRAAGAAPTVLNAANEVAVQCFLEGKMRFTDIPVMIEAALEGIQAGRPDDFDAALEIDRQARLFAQNWLSGNS